MRLNQASRLLKARSALFETMRSLVLTAAERKGMRRCGGASSLTFQGHDVRARPAACGIGGGRLNVLAWDAVEFIREEERCRYGTAPKEL